MPFYRYKCKSCDYVSKSVRRKISEMNDPYVCSECGTECEVMVAKALGAIVTEQPDVVSKYRNKNVRVGIDKELRQRAHAHFVEHEMDDLIQKHGVRDAKAFGWLDRKTGKKRKLIDEK